MNFTTNCRKVSESQKPEMKEWGFSFLLETELDALRVAYSYRNSPNGVKVEHCPNVGKYMVTVFNDKAKSMGIDV